PAAVLAADRHVAIGGNVRPAPPGGAAHDAYEVWLLATGVHWPAGIAPFRHRRIAAVDVEVPRVGDEGDRGVEQLAVRDGAVVRPADDQEWSVDRQQIATVKGRERLADVDFALEQQDGEVVLEVAGFVAGMNSAGGGLGQGGTVLGVRGGHLPVVEALHRVSCGQYRFGGNEHAAGFGG